MFTLINANKKIKEKVLFDNISFYFNINENYIILGKNGCGKTTLLNILMNYTDLDSGELIVNPKASSQYLFQEPLLFANLTVYDNLFIKCSATNCALENSDEKIKQVTDIFNLNQLLQKKVSVLSGGEKQAVQLAQLFIAEPNVLLLDEPTSMLDENNKKIFLGILDDAFSGIMKIIVTHDDVNLFPNYSHIRFNGGKLLSE